MGKKIFSGVQPTGNLHLGNYLGAIKNFVDLNNDKDNKCIFCVVDLHAITIRQDPKELKNNIRETVATFIASGIDPKKSIIFNQSRVAAHAEGAWILSCVARMGWLNRMTQFKEKAGKDKEKASIGLYSYPVLMAADILLYDTTHVPVGDDQKQHLELCRDIAQKFNNDLSQRLFKQAARELLLSESSDWSFILRAGTTTELAKERIERHLFRFWKLVEMIKNHSNINLKFLEDIEEEDKVFPDINIADWRK